MAGSSRHPLRGARLKTDLLTRHNENAMTEVDAMNRSARVPASP
jgi:hypothetical protein